MGNGFKIPAPREFPLFLPQIHVIFLFSFFPSFLYPFHPFNPFLSSPQKNQKGTFKHPFKWLFFIFPFSDPFIPFHPLFPFFLPKNTPLNGPFYFSIITAQLLISIFFKSASLIFLTASSKLSSVFICQKPNPTFS